MATLYNNPRGGLIVDRDSLHASPGYARQVEALKQLRERKVNADVEKAVERALARMENDDPQGVGYVRQALRDQEAEIADLKVDRDSWADQASDRVKDWDDMRQRAEKAEALLRGAYAFMQFADGHGPVSAQLMHRITAHLGGDHD